MKSSADIITSANNKLKVAEFLLLNGFYDDAYYLGGYSLELLLKAKICQTLAIPDFFDFDNSKSRKLPASGSRKSERKNLYRPFKVHDYEQLIILSGLYFEMANQIDSDPFFSSDWDVVNKWDESVRYTHGMTQKEVQLFIFSLKNIITWLQTYL